MSQPLSYRKGTLVAIQFYGREVIAKIESSSKSELSRKTMYKHKAKCVEHGKQYVDLFIDAKTRGVYIDSERTALII